MSDLVKTGSKYSHEQRMAVAVQYAVSGNAKKVAKDTGIPRTTIVGWKKQEWWVEIVDRVRQENDDKILAQASNIIELAQQVTVDKLTDASAAQASIIGATWVDKGRLIRNQPTSITGKVVSLDDLAKEFNKIATRQWDEKQVNVVETQDKSNEEE